MLLYEKINVYVPERIGNILENDMELFEIYKKDGVSINKNRFLSMLLIGYYEDYAKEINDKYTQLLTKIKETEEDDAKAANLARSLMNELMVDIPPRKGKNAKCFSLKPTKDTEVVLLSILDRIGTEDYISQYLCRLFASYCNKTIYERERIIFKDNYEKIVSACSNHRTISFCSVWDSRTIHHVAPHMITSGSEEMFNYLLCAEYDNKNKQQARTYRLNRISKVTISDRPFDINTDVSNYLNRMSKDGPQFPINDETETCVRLTERGKKLYQRIYYGRPRCNYVSGDDYHFNKSQEQLFLYFRRFGKDADVLYPKELRDRLTDFYREALNQYLV